MTPFLQATLGVSSGKVTLKCAIFLEKMEQILMLHYKESAAGWTALHYAAVNGDIELVKY